MVFFALVNSFACLSNNTTAYLVVGWHAPYVEYLGERGVAQVDYEGNNGEAAHKLARVDVSA